MHATWARRGSQPQIPTRGERNTQKIFGAVRLDNAGFIYLHQEDYFQWETYLAFLDQVVVPAGMYRLGPPRTDRPGGPRRCSVTEVTERKHEANRRGTPGCAS